MKINTFTKKITSKIFAPSNLKGNNHKIIINKKSNKLIIFFSDINTIKNNFDFYEINALLDSNIIFINNGLNEWYQNAIPSLGSSFQNVLIKIKTWITYLNIKEVYTCGQGMGAYGAILYGLHLRDTKILALSPEINLKQKDSNSFKYMKNPIYFDLHEIILNSKNNINMYAGEKNAFDINQISQYNNILNFPNINIISIADASHSLKNYFDKNKETCKVIQNFLNNEITSTVINEGFACSSVGFSDLYLIQTVSNKYKKWDESIHYGKEAIKIYPYCANSQYLLAVAYLRLNILDNALIHASLARSILPTNLDYQFIIANILRRRGFLQKSKYLHHKILQNNKQYAKSHYELSLIYAKIGDKKNALARINYARQLEPKNTSFKERAITFNKKFS